MEIVRLGDFGVREKVFDKGDRMPGVRGGGDIVGDGNVGGGDLPIRIENERVTKNLGCLHGPERGAIEIPQDRWRGGAGVGWDLFDGVLDAMGEHGTAVAQGNNGKLQEGAGG